MKKMNGWFPKRETCVILFSDNRSIFHLRFFLFICLFSLKIRWHTEVSTIALIDITLLWSLTTNTAKNRGKHFSLQTRNPWLLLIDGPGSSAYGQTELCLAGVEWDTLFTSNLGRGRYQVQQQLSPLRTWEESLLLSQLWGIWKEANVILVLSWY